MTAIFTPPEEAKPLARQVRDIARKAQNEGRPLTDAEADRAADLLNEITELEAKAVANTVDATGSVKADANVFDRDEIVALLKSADAPLDTGTKDAPYFALFADQMGHKAAQELLGDTDGFKGIDPTGSLTVLTSGMSVVDLPSQPIYIAQLCGDGGIGRAIRRPSFEYLVQTVRTNAAAPVAPGAVKPTSVYSVAEEQAFLRTIAHVSEPFERQILENHTSLSGFVSNEMVRGVALTVDSQLINGDGTGQNLTGVLSTSGIQAQAFATDVPTTLRKARTKLENIGKSPRQLLVVMHPDDVEALELTEGTDQHYKNVASVQSDGIARVWGVRILSTPVLAAGTAIMADWSSSRFHSFFDGVQMSWREAGTATYNAAEVELFERNLVQARAENRFGFAIERPGEFVVADLTA